MNKSPLDVRVLQFKSCKTYFLPCCYRELLYIKIGSTITGPMNVSSYFNTRMRYLAQRIWYYETKVAHTPRLFKIKAN